MSRISELPRRLWHEDAYADAAVTELTAALRTPEGTQTLRPIQAVAIREALQCGGLILNGRVGCGKTLVGALLATLYEDQRPLMFVPGGQDGKTDLELAEYRKHWELSHLINVETYSALSRDVDEQLLRSYSPGVIIADEVSKLQNVQRGGSGVAARMNAWMVANPATKFIGMSGTLFKEGLKDFGHVMNWALKDKAPIPRLPVEIESWHKGLKGNMGAWPKMRQALGVGPDADVRKAFKDRVFHSPGCVISVDQFTGVPLELETVALDSGTQTALQRLYATGETPDGLDLSPEGGGDADAGAGTTWAAERQLALGFYYRPDPTPPEGWAKARKRYYQLVRREICSGAYRTELQVRRHCEAAQNAVWLAWKAIEPTFTPRFVPVWLNTRALDYCKDWGKAGGIVWTDHRAFAERLSAETGWAWFGPGGVDASGCSIERCNDRTIIASRQANSFGRNLQTICGPGGEGWHRALITALPGNGRDFEQLLGRQHREGQQHAVKVDILFICRAHVADLRKVVALSEDEQEEMGRVNKVLTAAWR